jgi:hypothetical protein
MELVGVQFRINYFKSQWGAFTENLAERPGEYLHLVNIIQNQALHRIPIIWRQISEMIPIICKNQKGCISSISSDS